MTWLRNLLILGGIAGGVLLAIRPALESPPKPVPGPAMSQATPVVLNTARTAEQPAINLARPASLESAFGRSELTGVPSFSAPRDPLLELGFSREFDASTRLAVPRQAADVPAPRASEEFNPADDTPAPAERDLDPERLPAQARQAAVDAKASLAEGLQLLKVGLAKRHGGDARALQEANAMMAQAATKFEQARDSLRLVLEQAPGNADALALMQEAKANLYTARKHATGR